MPLARLKKTPKRLQARVSLTPERAAIILRCRGAMSVPEACNEILFTFTPEWGQRRIAAGLAPEVKP